MRENDAWFGHGSLRSWEEGGLASVHYMRGPAVRLLADLWLFVILARRRSLCPTSLTRNGGSSYSEEPLMEILWDGEARLWNEPIPGRLRRSHVVCAAWSLALSSLHRASARPGRQRVRSPHVRGDALLGRRPSRVGRGGARLRGGVAEPTEVGCVALVEVGRPQRHTCRG